MSGPHEVAYDPIRRYNALAKVLREPRGAKTSEHLRNLRRSDPCYGSLTPSKERANLAELSYDPMKRYNAMAKLLSTPKGAKSVEHMANLRLSDPCYGSLAPLKERPNHAELPYDPIKRYNAMAKHTKPKRGTKTTEHLYNLRKSDPCYGSLTPSKERPNIAEYTYDPVRRFAALAHTFKPPKGYKSVEELEALRQSDPCYGSLVPSKERANIAELPYDPARRFSALAKVLREPRGAKPFEHLRNLRLSDPSYGALVPSKHPEEAEEEEEEGAKEEDYLEAWGVLGGTTRQRASSTGYSSGMGSGRLPRILSNQQFEPLEDEDDEEATLSPLYESSRAPMGAATKWAPLPASATRRMVVSPVHSAAAATLATLTTASSIRPPPLRRPHLYARLGAL